MVKVLVAALGVLAIATQVVVDAKNTPPVVNCKLDKWQADGPCDTKTFTQKWTRAVKQKPSEYGKACAKTEEFRSCKPVHCQMSKWTEWSDHCNADGYKIRTRKEVRKPKNGGRECPHGVDKVKCCEDDCRVSDWGDWTCDAYTNKATRTRSILREAKSPKGAPCPSEDELTQTKKKCGNRGVGVGNGGGNGTGDEGKGNDKDSTSEEESADPGTDKDSDPGESDTTS